MEMPVAQKTKVEDLKKEGYTEVPSNEPPSVGRAIFLISPTKNKKVSVSGSGEVLEWLLE